MTKIVIFSGFLGSGKTTLIKKLIAEAYKGEKLVLIENEFGEIGIDGGFLQDSGVTVNEMNSGCICCTLVGDFSDAMDKMMAQFSPDRILIEPSGVGKLSDVTRAVQDVHGDLAVNSMVTVVDATKCKMYMKNFGEFFNNQVEHAGTIVLSRTANISEEKLNTCIALLREKNPGAIIITTPWDQLDGAQILEAMEQRDTLNEALELLAKEAAEHEDEDECCCHHHHHDDDDDDEHEHEHHHHHHEDGEECHCHHHDDDDDDDEHEHEHHHHHHEDGEECHCHHHDEHEHHHHHEDGEECHCHEHHHHHHHHGEHDADEVFTSWGKETARKYTMDEIRTALEALNDADACGAILRAKGIVAGEDGWIHFDFVPGEANVRHGSAGVTGRLCVIGSQLKEDAIAALFHV